MCWFVEEGCSQGCEELNLVLLWFWCWLTSRPLRLRPKSRTGSSGTDKGLHSLWVEGRGGWWDEGGVRTRGKREREGGWRAERKGSYPPGSNTCHQLLPPSCAFIKKPPCAPLGNPHALLKKCEVNTVCLSIPLPLPSLFWHLFPFIAPSFFFSMMCSAGQ